MSDTPEPPEDDEREYEGALAEAYKAGHTAGFLACDAMHFNEGTRAVAAQRERFVSDLRERCAELVKCLWAMRRWVDGTDNMTSYNAIYDRCTKALAEPEEGK